MIDWIDKGGRTQALPANSSSVVQGNPGCSSECIAYKVLDSHVWQGTEMERVMVPMFDQSNICCGYSRLILLSFTGKLFERV